MDFEIGQKVMILKIDWDGNPIRLNDAEGEITSIKGISENHNSIHKYEVTWRGGKFMNDGKRLRSKLDYESSN